MDNTSLFEDYLDGILEMEAKAGFENRLREEPALAAAFHHHLGVRDIVRAYGALATKEKLRAYEKRQYGSPSRRWFMAVAVAVLLGLLLLTWYTMIHDKKPTTPEGIFAAYFTPYRDPVNVRGSETTDDSRYQANEAYRAGDYPRASAGYAQIENPVDADLFYHGLSSLLSADTEQAIALLTQVASRSGDFQQQARWYLALTYVKQGRYAQARILLAQIADNNEFHHVEAKKLLKDLN
jgi:tetratricopeptide (TPR) repeat protein